MLRVAAPPRRRATLQATVEVTVTARALGPVLGIALLTAAPAQRKRAVAEQRLFSAFGVNPITAFAQRGAPLASVLPDSASR